MPRRPNVIPNYRLSLWVPQDLKDRLDLLLWSEAENRVPHGAYAAFFATLLKSRLDAIEQERRDAQSRTTDPIGSVPQ